MICLVNRSAPAFKFSPVLALLLLAACAGERGAVAPSTSANGGGVYKVGQPYQIKGIWYYPKEDYSYDETGIASWYGGDFHGQLTANGEIFNKNELTAAHKTLPMPSLARVTNLENGKSIVVRVNDRGPFSGARVIDVTQRVAELLGFDKQGTAKVRVQVLADESKAIADAMRKYGSSSPQFAAAAATQPTVTAAPLAPVATAPLSQSEMNKVMATIQPVAEVRQLPVSGTNQIYVQAGSFTRLDNATQLKRQLSKVGTASVVDVMVNGVKFYRVRLGPIPDVAKADAMLKKVTTSGTSGARIIVD